MKTTTPELPGSHQGLSRWPDPPSGKKVYGHLQKLEETANSPVSGNRAGVQITLSQFQAFDPGPDARNLFSKRKSKE